MLKNLHIENIAVVKSADIEFPVGFTVLTGETGAGKSVIIDSINMLSGGKVSRDVIRAGEDFALAEAVFDGVEGIIAKAVFAIPAVKGVEFGAGFEASKMRGSQNNDPFRMENGRVVTETNNCGGILGGITDGMPIIFRAAIKPTPSIAQKQKTVDLQKRENAELEIKGRHDPCIVPRAVPVVEAAAAIALINIIQEEI